jgi:hypothetical protein
MSASFEGKVALVTDVGTSIGAATARLLAKAQHVTLSGRVGRLNLAVNNAGIPAGDSALRPDRRG